MTTNMNQSHAITINEKQVKIMMTEIEKPPKLLNKSAGKSSCCIFRVPRTLVELQKEAYQPQIVSIGPYHYGNKDLEMIQEHKGRLLVDMIKRTSKPLGLFINIIAQMDDKIRECYSESIDRFATNDLAKMMVLDGVFLIELFRKVGKLVSTHQDDPIFKMGWIYPILMRDLLRIENQIPFFVLQKLFEESKADNTCTLQSLILAFFNSMVGRQPGVLMKCENLDGKHLLDLFRTSFIYTKKIIPRASNNNDKINNPSLKLIRPATKLVNVGVKFKPNYLAHSFLDVEFQNGLLLIPQINMDDFHSSFFMNCIAFEQCYYCSTKEITSYVVFMGCLMSTSADISLLSENNIIENYFGTDEELAKFFQNAGKDVAFDIKAHYLFDLFEESNEYWNGWNVGWAGFKHTYFESPWALISAFAAFILLSLAALQTFYTIFPYYHKND